MRHQRRSHVRSMQVERTPRDRGLRAVIVVDVYDNGDWRINGDPCFSDLAAGREVMECVEALAASRDAGGVWRMPRAS